ncbi:MAG: trypsin-like peptidase domain-containing protein [Dehalococcoidia bacterium]|nr:trypsin-like peptidase domain-containing protein [Dehalococcoidia bacterium]
MPAGVYVENDILPIFVVMNPGTVTPALFRGTGFLIAPNILITCWHCVCGSLESGQQYAAVVEERGKYSAHFLINREQHPLGLDLAIARVDLVPKLNLVLSAKELSPGDEVMTYGYPLTDRLLTDSEHVRSHLNARFLQGYVTRSYYYSQPGFVRTPSYELDIPVPHSLYGAPIIKLGSKEIAGVFFGSLDIPRVERISEVDRESEKQQVEIERVASFGLAHYTDSLWSLRGAVTQGRPLREFLGFDSKVSRGVSERIVSPKRLVAEPAREGIRISAEITSLWGQAKQALVNATFRREETKAVAEREELLHKLEKYRQRLTPEQLESLTEERKVVEQLRAMYPSKYPDPAT